jgi:transposase
MTTMPLTASDVTGVVDTHADDHVAAACDAIGAALGARSFPATGAGYRQLLRWLRGFGVLGKVGVEGTGSYGVGLARYLAMEGIEVIEVNRPNRQVRRRHGKTDVVDAIAAARAVINGDATGHPKSHDGGVEALRALKIVHRSAHKSRTQALHQIRDLVTTAPEELRDELHGLKRRILLRTCAAFRPADRDDLTSITKLALRGLARRVIRPRRRDRPARRAPSSDHHQYRASTRRRVRCRPGHRVRAAARRWGQLAAASQRTELVGTAGVQPDRGIVREARPAPAQPWWGPAR